jgi:plastocyanin
MRHCLALLVLGTSGMFVECSNSNSPSSMDAGSSSSSSGSASSSGSGSSSGSSSSSGGGAGTTKTVMFDFTTTEATLNGGKGQVVNANVGDTVVWQNDDVCPAAEATAAGCPIGSGVQHGVIGCTDLVNSICGVMDAGAWGGYAGAVATGSTTAPPIVGQFQFTTAGTYLYECSIHGNMMIGQVVVSP